jgi:medium-chain acyl-[acyl-carrier-protein] hydrolase
METSRATFTVQGFDADAFGFLAPAALAGYLQEAAVRSSTALGAGLANLNRRGLTWVLLRQQVLLDEQLRLGDALEVETWHSGIDRLAALRDFRIRRGGVEVGRARATRIAVDLATRRPVRPEGVLPERLRARAEHLLEPPALPVLREAAVDRRFQVRFADIDSNQHVTSASYVAWALEAVDEATWRREWVASFDVQYLAECRLGSFVHSRSAPEGGRVRLHAIVREEDGRELARLRTTWAVRHA